MRTSQLILVVPSMNCTEPSKCATAELGTTVATRDKLLPGTEGWAEEVRVVVWMAVVAPYAGAPMPNPNVYAAMTKSE